MLRASKSDALEAAAPKIETSLNPGSPALTNRTKSKKSLSSVQPARVGIADTAPRIHASSAPPDLNRDAAVVLLRNAREVKVLYIFNE